MRYKALVRQTIYFAPLYIYSTRYRAAESDTIEFEDLVTAETRAVSLCTCVM